MEELLDQQDKLAKWISHSYDNFKKNGKDKMTKGTVEARIDGLDNYKSRFDKNHLSLMATYKELLKEQPYWKSDLVDTVEEAYLTQKGLLLDFLATCNPKQPTSQAVAQPKSHVRPLELPSFDGKYEDWPGFKDLFLSIIDRAQGLSDIERLQHLKVSLKGDAYTLVKDLATTASNYPRAWRLLADHYENQRILVGLALSKLTSLTKMKSESATELNNIFLGITSMVNTLEGIGRPVGQHEDLLVFLVVELLDGRTRNEWEMATNSSATPPSFEELRSFLDRRIQALNKTQLLNKGELPKQKPTSTTPPRPRARAFHVFKSKQTSFSKCPLCQGDHIILFCEIYKSKTGVDRKKAIEQCDHCLNCLGKHRAQECRSPKTCQVCKERHHTSLHDAFNSPSASSRLPSSASGPASHQCSFRTSSVLLATARVQVADGFGNFHTARALIDQGSETTLVTERLTQRLQLKRTRSEIAIFGIGGQQNGVARGKVQLTLRSHFSQHEITSQALVMPRLSIYAAKFNNSSLNWKHLQGLTLADPTFYENDQIDLILGADVHSLILMPGLRKGDSNQPIAQNTLLGWILSGRFNDEGDTQRVSTYHCSVGDPLSSLVRSFWEQEEPALSPSPKTDEEIKCEEHYNNTHQRTSSGRYMVRLPLKSHNFDVSATRMNAHRALVYAERKFLRNPDFQNLYLDFMVQYEELNHMSKATRDPTSSRVAYLPHHGVLRENSTTTKLRVVFNGSAKVPTGESLNDFLMTGPNLLPALADILLKWRTHSFVLATDIEKMYRQIIVDPRDRDLQRILWRDNTNRDISEYQLNTVTYGLACAPFLAIRTMHQLARDEAANYPLASSAVLADMYVDDILTGADSEEDLMELKNQLINLCQGGGFPLQKWASNSTTFMEEMSPTDNANSKAIMLKTKENTHLTLGLLWHPSTDTFSFTVKPMTEGACTRRSILSQSAQLFDPLGWLTPMTVKAKILIQSTWQLNLDWDTPLPDSIATSWTNFRTQWNSLTTMQIPRQAIFKDAKELEIMGYCDASEQAYAAVVYAKQFRTGDSPTFSLLAAKSKVAPLKQVSLPRLELCSARLLVQLTKHVVESLNLKQSPIHLWTDSTVTLGWIRGQPHRWKTYVANRVSEIQSLLPEATWHHIPGRNNPADCASRGISPEELINHPLWWHGPGNLDLTTPVVSDGELDQELPETRAKQVMTTTTKGCEENPILLRFSSYTRLLRVTAYCLRWLHRVRTKEARVDSKHITQRHLTTSEIDQAELLWIKLSQTIHFKEETSCLLHQKPLPRTTSLQSLTPFLDEKFVLRVGGRLQLSSLPLEQKHAIILSPSSRLTEMLVEAYHRRTLHGGVQLTLSSLRQRFWIPKGRSLVKAVIHRCTTCIRWRAVTPKFIMGSLPAPRVTAARPFLHTGVDYAGPVQLRTSPGRGHKSYKGFFVIFVCLSSRAVHLDLASSYSSEAFLAAFKRFISRRGMCSDLYSDQGTNFIGADAEIKRMLSTSTKEGQFIADTLATLRVKWHFNPPGAPHFGGIWEAAVKSTKYHLRRILGESTLTYEEMTTLLAQIEACLNSRPLCALSDDADDLEALTPGHLLVGTALNQLPEPSLLDQKISQLSRWQLVTQMRDHFWKRWSTEYLHAMVPRSKWQQQGPNIAPGALCLILHDATPPARWPLGRIIAVHPGLDGQVRVATVKTATSTFKRPVTKLIMLPPISNEAC